MVDEGDVAAIAAHALLDGRHAGIAFLLSGPKALSYPEMADQIGKALGKPVSYIDVTEAQAKSAMLGMGLPEWIVDFINDLRRFERDRRDYCSVGRLVSDQRRLVMPRHTDRAFYKQRCCRA